MLNNSKRASRPQKAFGKVAGKQAEAYEPPVSQPAQETLRMGTVLH